MGILFRAVTGNDFTDAVYSLTLAALEEAGRTLPEAAESLAQLHASKAFQVAFDPADAMWFLVADGVDIKARFREEDVNTLVAEAQRVRNQQRPN